MPNLLRLALIQMHIDAGHPEPNFARLEQRLTEAVAASPKPDVILVPEMWNTGYALDRIRELADPAGARTRSFVSEFAKRHGVNIVAGSIAELREGNDGRASKVTNTVYGFDRQGEEIAEYSKIHLFKLMDEHLHLEAGEKPGRFELEGYPAGVMICYDIRFPELARKLALEGAKVLFVPAEWPHPRLHHWRTLLQARAIENQMYVVACNRTGISGTTHFFGHSMVIDPWGEIVAEAGEEETILTAEIDLDLADEVRGRIPVFADRRPSLYE
ncbi:carbon-nitrogen family hydrolase [Cohnella thailandensis]|uniref:Carbon-nitrogen family hydrolase n=1 Tax=Cohnella thailandensis TaxID=557557 RepID=A0A841T1N9_9BACL|nr:carbon-nitrogen family hydrolase [Cohnella thailandensis]MBB6636766.1 carbon-nitrogen family hydrolase [Cohnella thailandensis]MBP1973358.1 putative amidohydrolase [Cohnella thailandensis]